VLLSSILGATVGLLLAFPPLKTDAEFRAAMERGDVEKMSRVVQQMSSSAYLVGLTLQKAVTDGNQPVSDGLNNYLNDNYPRDMYGWRVRYAKPWATPTEKALAIQKMRALDPYNPEIPQS